MEGLLGQEYSRVTLGIEFVDTYMYLYTWVETDTVSKALQTSCLCHCKPPPLCVMILRLMMTMPNFLGSLTEL